MNQVQQTVIVLMKSALTGEKFHIPEDSDPEKIYDLLKQHGLLSLGYRGAMQCGLDKNLPIMQRLFRDYCVSAVVSQRQMEAIQKLFAAFESEKIPYLPVKGCLMKGLYPYPELRTMGDADILIHEEQYDRIRQVMLSLGYTEGIRTDHELVWSSQALMVELHRRLIPSTDPEFFRYYGEGWKKAVRYEGCHAYMSDEDAFLYIFTHFVKHFRRAGIGLRQLLDIWVYGCSYPQMDREYLSGELRKLNLLEFYGNIQRLLTAMFEDQTMDPLSQQILEYILSCGSWGTAENALLSEGVEKIGASDSTAHGRLMWALDMVFPKRNYMQYQFPSLNRYGFLLPFCWVIRWLHILLFRRQNIGGRIEEYRTLNDEKLTDRRQLLNQFGLRF